MCKYIILVLTCLSFLTSSCTEEYESRTFENNTVTFLMQLSSYVDESEASTRISNSAVSFSSLHYYILNEIGEIVEPLQSNISGDYQSVSMSGLKSGHYSIVFLAIENNGENNDIVHELKTPQELWLNVSDSDNTVNRKGYYWGEADFDVQADQVLSLSVTLKNMSSRITVEVNSHQQTIQNIQISLNESVATGFTGEGLYTGNKNIQNLSLTQKHSIEVFPLNNGTKVSGKITVTFTDIDGVLNKESYLFSDCVLETNKISTLKVELPNPYNGLDQINMSPDEYTKENTWRMLTDSEPDSILFNQGRRSFRVHAPLQVDLNTEGKFHLKFYSAHPINNAHILAKFRNISDEYIEIAHFERIEIFQESYIPFTLSGDNDKKYKTESGRIITILPGIKVSTDLIDFKIVCNDPYWKKIEQIKSRWLIRFSPFGTSAEKPTNGDWRYIRPTHCRQAVALFTNIAWMNETEEYREILVANNGTYWLDSAKTKFIEDNTILISSLRNRPGFVVGMCGGGVDGLAGGSDIGLAGYIFNSHYTSDYPAYVVFHELGHCMGYGHGTAMTQGYWSQRDAKLLYLKMAKESRLPVSDGSWQNNFPN